MILYFNDIHPYNNHQCIVYLNDKNMISQSKKEKINRRY